MRLDLGFAISFIYVLSNQRPWSSQNVLNINIIYSSCMLHSMTTQEAACFFAPYSRSQSRLKTCFRILYYFFFTRSRSRSKKIRIIFCTFCTLLSFTNNIYFWYFHGTYLVNLHLVKTSPPPIQSPLSGGIFCVCGLWSFISYF